MKSPLFFGSFPWGLPEWLFTATIALAVIAILKDVGDRRRQGLSDWAMMGFFTISSLGAIVLTKQPETLRLVALWSPIAVAFMSILYMDVNLMPLGGFFLAQGTIAAVTPGWSVYSQTFLGTALPLGFFADPTAIAAALFACAAVTFAVNAIIFQQDFLLVILGIFSTGLLFVLRSIVELVPFIQGSSWKMLVAFAGTAIVVLVIFIWRMSRVATEEEWRETTGRLTQIYARTTKATAFLLYFVALVGALIVWFQPV